MNPLFQLASILAARRKKLERRCQSCGHVQQVAQSQVRDTVRCARCSASIAPPPKA